MKRGGKRSQHTETVVVLHNIRSAANVGSILRTADAAGVAEVVFTGYTPLPTDRFGRARRDIAKAALGAEQTVLWRHEGSAIEALKRCASRGFETVAVEQHPRAIDYRALPPARKRVLVFGNEIEGLPEDVIKQCSLVAEIPLYGSKESLNVAVAGGVTLFGMLPRPPLP